MNGKEFLRFFFYLSCVAIVVFCLSLFLGSLVKENREEMTYDVRQEWTYENNYRNNDICGGEFEPGQFVYDRFTKEVFMVLERPYETIPNKVMVRSIDKTTEYVFRTRTYICRELAPVWPKDN